MKDRIFRLCDTVRETAYALHRYLGPVISKRFTRTVSSIASARPG